MSAKQRIGLYVTPEEEQLLRNTLEEHRLREKIESLGYEKRESTAVNSIPESRKSQILFLLYKYDYGIRNNIRYSYENMDRESIESWMIKDEENNQGKCFDRLYEECKRCFGDFKFDYDCIIKWYNKVRYKEEPEEEPKPKKDKNLNPFLGKKNLKKHKESEQS